MLRKRKLETVGGGGDGGRKAVEVKLVKSDLPPPSPSANGKDDNCEEGCGDRDDLEAVQQERRTDWQVLVAIFPEEVWMLILESIKDPDVLEALSNASLVFRDLLLPRRVQFLFPKVWGILGIKYHEAAVLTSCDEVYLEPPSYSSPLPWNRSRRRPGSENQDPLRAKWHTGIIKLRMVCRDWCDALDNLYQNQSYRYKLRNEQECEERTSDSATNRILSLSRLVFDAHNVRNKVERFRNHFESTHCANGVAIRNPFLGRAVILYIGFRDAESEQSREFLERLRVLLRKYGSHIWYLTIKVEDTFFSRIACYSVLRTVLQGVPNLRILHLDYCLAARRRDAQVVPVSRGQLEAYIRLNQLPNLDRLQFLTTRNFSSYLPPPLFKELVRASGNMSILEVGHDWSTLRDTNVSSETLPNLQQLSMTIPSRVNFEAFFASDVGWRLSKLDLDLDEATGLEWDRIFKELEMKWAETLTTLILTLPRVELMEDQNRLLFLGGDLRLHLPRLSHLNLEMETLCCLDFLLPMKDSLQVLDLHLTAEIQREEQLDLVKRLENGKMIQLLSCPDKPMDSNIWTLFPKLTRVKFLYSLESHSDVRVNKNAAAETRWSVSRSQWQNWKKKSCYYRRKMTKLWKIKHVYW